MRPALEEYLTVVTLDRRGRGDSGDGPDYAIEREFEDVLAVALDAPCLLFGHSFGAVCALGAALRTGRLAGLILYEPGMVLEEESLFSPAQLERFDRLLAADDREGILRMLLVEIVGIPVHEMEEIMAAPTWSNSLAAAPTVPREVRALETYRLPAEQADRLSTPVLLLLDRR